MVHDSHSAFAECFIRDQHRVYRYILTLVPVRSDAEELFQQTSLTLWKQWDQYDASRPFVPWACGIAHNHIRNFLRTHKEDRRVYLSEDLMQQVAAARLACEDTLDQRRAALDDCLDKLDASQRRLLQRCYESDQPLGDIAAQRGQTPNALYKTLRRLRRALHDCINRALALETGASGGAR